MLFRSIAELGLDSLERIEIIAALEDTFGGRFPEEILPGMETCGEVVEAIEAHLGGEVKTRPARPAQLSVLEEDYVFAKSSDYLRFRKDYQRAWQPGVPNPFFKVHEGITNDRTVIEGTEYINFCSYNYLGMSGDPVVIEATQKAVSKFGTSVSASRLVSGEKPLHVKLERAIADLIGVEDSVVFVGGHSTNESTIGHLFGPGDLILHDGLAHNSIVQGCKLSGARARFFPHNDWQACDALLDELWSYATRPEHFWHHRWRVGDVILWDNRRTLHRRRKEEEESYQRHRGVPSFEQVGRFRCAIRRQAPSRTFAPARARESV